MPRQNDLYLEADLSDNDGEIRANPQGYAPNTGDPYHDEDTEEGDPDDDDSYDESGDPDSDDDEQGDARPRASRSKKSKRRGILKSILLPGSGARARRKHRASVTGSKRLRSRRKPPQALNLSRAARLRRSSNSDEQKQDPAFAADLAAKKLLKKAAAPDVLYERFLGIEERIYGDLPPDAALRPAEATAVKNAVFANPVFSPRQFTMVAISASVFRLYISDALAAVLPTGAEFLWAGDIIRVAASQLQAEPQEIEIRRMIGGTMTRFSYTIPVATNLSRFTYFNGVILAAVPRLSMAQVTSDPVPDPNNYIEVANLDTTKYRATMRLLVPGDKAVESLLRKL